MNITVKNPAPPPEATFEPSIILAPGGGFIIRATRTDKNPQESNTLLVISRDGSISRPDLDKMFREHFKCDIQGRIVVNDSAPVV